MQGAGAGEGRQQPRADARNRAERICLVVNPRAAAGRMAGRIDELRRAVDRVFETWDLRLTEGPRHAERLAASAAREGFDLVAAVGGDGTCGEVVNGLFDGDRVRSPKIALCVVPFGTGSDLVRTLRTPTDLDAALRVASNGVTLPTDIGVVDLVGPDGNPVSRKFVNVAGFGAQGDVVRRVNAMDKRWGGGVTFFVAALASALRYEPQPARLSWEGPDGDDRWEGRLLSAFVANGQYCGGGMWVARDASMQDGILDLTTLVPTPFSQQLVDVRRLYDGHLERMRGTRRAVVTALRAEAPDAAGPVPVDLDGELAGALPASFRVLERRLPVRAGWRQPRAGG
jgi:YegS/Rv2252/BmrU family lipid kinase